jgi:uncharacterized damage-inducible protein DinB
MQEKNNLEFLQYPIGKPNIPNHITPKDISNWILILEEFPEKLSVLTQKLSEEQLDTRYRENGWTIRQVIHHLYDSHHNSYTRFKWTLTENKPVIKTYFEEKWAELPDGKLAPIQLSLNALTALHAKWAYLLKTLSPEQLNRVFIHPDGNEEVTLAENIGIYAWHCNHHFAHIYELKKRENW